MEGLGISGTFWGFLWGVHLEDHPTLYKWLVKSLEGYLQAMNN